MRAGLGEWTEDDALRRVFLAQCNAVEMLVELGQIEQALGALQALGAGVSAVGPRAFGREDVPPGGEGG